MFSGKVIARLKKAHYGLDALPETVSSPQCATRPYIAAMPIEKATLDDLAFAIIAADQECTVVLDRVSALKRLYRLGREAGGVGTDPAVATTLKAGAQK